MNKLLNSGTDPFGYLSICLQPIKCLKQNRKTMKLKNKNVCYWFRTNRDNCNNNEVGRNDMIRYKWLNPALNSSCFLNIRYKIDGNLNDNDLIKNCFDVKWGNTLPILINNNNWQ